MNSSNSNAARIAIAVAIKPSGDFPAARAAVKAAAGELELRMDEERQTISALFATPSDAVIFALRAQHACGRGAPARVALHMAETEAGDLTDRAAGLWRAAEELLALCAPGQVLLTRPIFDNARPLIKGRQLAGIGALEWLNHGTYLAPSFPEPIEVCEVGEAGMAPMRAPEPVGSFRRPNAKREEEVSGWRPAVDQPVPGTDLRIERRLGAGGFGEVWLARDRGHAPRVLKFCFDPDRVRSLKREASLFNLLKDKFGSHPRILPLLDFHVSDRPHFLVTEFVAGLDLKNWAERIGGIRGVPLRQRLEIVAQTAEGLEAAHQAGVIHRDIKPGNILVETETLEPQGPGPSVKLADFGIGKINAELPRALPGLTVTMIEPASAFQTGTFIYMAPEVIGGRAATPQSDIFSLGIVLYQLVKGDFQSPPSSEWRQEIEDAGLREILAQSIAGDPSRRFASAGEMARALRDWSESPAARPRPGPKGRLKLAAAAAVIALIGLAIAWKSNRSSNRFRVASASSGEAAAPAAAALADSLAAVLGEAEKLTAAGVWRKALPLLAQAAALKPADTVISPRYATLLAYLREDAGYGAYRQVMLETFRDSKSAEAAERAAKACLLLPGPAKETRRACELADRAVELGQGNDFLPYFEFARSLADYRRGRFAEAAASAEKLARNSAWSPFLNAQSWTVLAMARHRLNEAKAAREALANAAKIIAERLTPLESNNFDAGWHDVLATHILHREAAGLVAPGLIGSLGRNRQSDPGSVPQL